MPHLEVTLEEAEANYCMADCRSGEAACCALAREAAGSAKSSRNCTVRAPLQFFSIFFFATFINISTFCYFQFQRFHFHINIFKPDPQATLLRKCKNVSKFAEICAKSYAQFPEISEIAEIIHFHS